MAGPNIHDVSNGYWRCRPSCCILLACMMMMIVCVTFNSNLVPLSEGLCSSNPCKFENSVWDGIEPTTLGLTVPRSDQLSHACTWGTCLVWNTCVSMSGHQHQAWWCPSVNRWPGVRHLEAWVLGESKHLDILLRFCTGYHANLSIL